MTRYGVVYIAIIIGRECFLTSYRVVVKLSAVSLSALVI